MDAPQKVTQALFLPGPTLAEMKARADEFDRALTWIVEQAWNEAAPRIRELPAGA